jgi:pantoate--beta-alanine ligase
MTPSLSRTCAKYRAACDRARADGQRLALVPTMGALHEGHVALIRAARERADRVFVSIFVNPTQFGPTEDFEKYPRDIEGDLRLCQDAEVDRVFAPAVSEMYPEDELTRVRVAGLTDHLCGAGRPGHFEGVATVVAKLFGLTGPCVAVFGRKDYQQLKVIERLTRDLMLPVEVVGCPTVRESDGLALSSRNRYLSDEDRERAVVIPEALSAAVRAFERGERRAGVLGAPVAEAMAVAGLDPEYVTIADADQLHPLSDDTEVGERALLAVAARVGEARLIDNVVLGEDPAPIEDTES